jgi:DtxR family Mn-dependent transcriptional regulator
MGMDTEIEPAAEPEHEGHGHGGDGAGSAVRDDYLETLYNLEMEGEPASGAVLARRFGVSRATVSATLHRLTRTGLIEGSGRGEARLTAEGRRQAERVLRRHRLAERFLVQTLGLDWITAHEQAHHLQTGLTPLLEASITATLGHPATCPHGNPIPGEVPDATSYLRDQGAVRLSTVPVGQTVTVVCISELVEDESALLRYVGEKGLRPAARVRVLERAPGPQPARPAELRRRGATASEAATQGGALSRVAENSADDNGVLHLQVRDSTVAVDAHLATLIWVRPAEG